MKVNYVKSPEGKGTTLSGFYEMVSVTTLFVLVRLNILIWCSYDFNSYGQRENEYSQFILSFSLALQSPSLYQKKARGESPSHDQVRALHSAGYALGIAPLLAH